MDNQLISQVVDSKLPSQSEEQVTVIKRYPNRKLYNPSVSSYVTLKDIFKMVQENEKVQIINHKTEEDVTTSVLLNALVDGSKEQNNNEVASLLKHLARYINQLNALPSYEKEEGENNG